MSMLEADLTHRDPWDADPDWPRFLFEGWRFGALGGGLLGLVVGLHPDYLRSGEFLLFTLIGVLLGMVYGLVVAVVSWPLGLLLLRVGVARRKALALTVAVVLLGVVAVAVSWPVRGPDRGFLFYPGLIAIAMAIVVGIRYDRRRAG